MLCLLALRDEEAAAFLRSQNWKETLADLLTPSCSPESWKAICAPEPASLNAFMSTLARRRSRWFRRWLMQKLPEKPACWRRNGGVACGRGLSGSNWRSRKARMKASQLSAGEVVNLQKQILDLTDQLHELSQFSPGPSTGS